ncbi:stage III sporulation protein AF [Lachnospiraceae bacterium AM25-11LB]|jgi:stage III sporulation protein AF|nr:stage III sporulation protein AF [Lachnospiraceae bacterium AM25-22]RGD08786.1 stage III sporulation protein AF [Lachnospiraceae bacterium AM25-11LB]RJW12651.1 stage III sporulation protein AF [Lachnospiraceae bacterium AM25-40]RJW16779.1 stage III sporulation protein AF [Lachnospiraceae bacterium AM25-39]
MDSLQGNMESASVKNFLLHLFEKERRKSMLSQLYSWLQNVVCYFFLLTVVMNLLPDDSYKKYIRYYMGLLLILTFLSPIFQITDMGQKLESYIESFEGVEIEAQEWEEKAEAWEQSWEKEIEILRGQEVEP